MKKIKPLSDFFERIKSDPYICSSHIAVFTALYSMWLTQDCRQPLIIFSYTVMPQAKVNGLGTYHKAVKQLDEFGYIKYLPSCNRKGSKVYFIM